MNLAISGMGWVTPLGGAIQEVWQCLLNGDKAVAETISSPLSDRTYQVYRVPPVAIAKAPAHPRLRRSSAISRFAVVAGLAALGDAEVKIDSTAAERMALIFAISNGGVVYTKRFYHEIVESGAQAASPLLFPETVFNAPASHLAAILGITGASYTLVGDGAVGLLALKMAEDLMQNPALDRCLVVGAEEADWLLCDAYRKWRLLPPGQPIRPSQTRSSGMILSEGAGAILIERTGATRLEKIDAGGNFRRQRDAATCVSEVLSRIGARNDDLIIASANGTFIDAAEKFAIGEHCPQARVYAPKISLGESVGASSLWQIICGAQALRTGQLPPLADLAPSQARSSVNRVVVSACGLNQQVAGLSLVRA
jgi:3-oxoacyl-(acyl-carrier-protein) synthase